MSSDSISTEPQKTAETAVWYFLGATFVIALGPTLFSGSDPQLWQTVLFLAIGLVLIACGGIVFAKERRLRKEARSYHSLRR